MSNFVTKDFSIISAQTQHQMEPPSAATTAKKPQKR